MLKRYTLTSRNAEGVHVNLSKHILDCWKKQTGTLRISENITFTNDDVMIYVLGALHIKLPRSPLPFNPALACWKTFVWKMILSFLSMHYHPRIHSHTLVMHTTQLLG